MSISNSKTKNLFQIKSEYNSFFPYQLKTKLNIQKIFIILIVGLFFVIIGNVLNDPNSLFHDHKNGITWREPNQNFLKVKHLLSLPPKKILIFGSSRVQTIPFSKIKDSNSHYGLNINPDSAYNMGTYGRTLWNTWHDLQILEKHNKLPEIILLGLDEATYVSTDNSRQQLKVSIAYPDGFIEWFNFIKVYLITKNQSSYEFLERFFYPKINVAHYFDLDKSGEIFYQQLESSINSNIEHWKMNDVFNINYLQRTGPASPENIEYLEKIVLLCKKQNIQLKVFFNPVYKKFFLQADFEKLFEFKKNVSTIIDFYDFQANDLTAADKAFWYDQDHYRPNLGQIILNEVLYQADPGKDKNSRNNLHSVFVNPSNVNQVIENQRDYLRKNNPPNK